MYQKYAAACVVMAILAPPLARAQTGDACANLTALYPQPGRAGMPGENAFRPLPLMSPVRSAPGAAGTLSLSIAADHVSSAAAGKPGSVYVGNYLVTDIPVFRIGRGAATSAEMVPVERGATHQISDQCLASPDWAFSGTQWALTQGDTLDVLFTSHLDYAGPNAIEEPTNGAVPCRSSNLHTHGLLVSPYHPIKAGVGPYGDYVLDVTQTRDSKDYGSIYDTCGTALGAVMHNHHGVTSLPLHYVTQIPGTPGVSSMASGQHPSGLFWYHPHPHGFSQPQVAGGTTGAITVGQLTDYACPDGDGSPGNCQLVDTNVRVLALKDTEIQPFIGGKWSTLHSSESGLCAVSGGIRHGECQAAEGGTPGKWVFTINGVQYPTLHASAGRMEIWRIVNSSANMTYGLVLEPEAGGANLPFQVLATDGVSIKPNAGAALRTVLMIMPATRVEIAIPAPAQGGGYVIRNISVQTGQSGSGDIWPNIDLGRIVWAKGAAGAAAPETHVAIAGPVTPVPTVAPGQDALPPRCRFAAGDSRVVYFVHRFVLTFMGGLPASARDAARLQQALDDDDAPAAAGPPSAIKPSIHEVFGLIAARRNADRTLDFFGDDGSVLHSVDEVWAAGKKDGDPDFPGFGHNKYGTICTVKGNVEPWELQNWTGEDHNFHIHQSRFTVDPNGRFQFPDAALEPTEDATLHRTDGLLREFLDPATATAFHDTVPVPRGQSLCRANPDLPGCHHNPHLECTGTPGSSRCARPGIMSVLMDFSRAEQVGTFVYHCHILEHEDGGMMAMISVLCPPGDSSCAAQQAAANICRAPGEK